jgi:16S rRNA processing protein RimM
VSERVEIGRVGRPHGLDGSFVVEDASEDERWFAVGARVLIAGGEAEVVASKRAGGRPVLKLDQAAPRGAALEVERALLPEPGEDEYYVFQLVGLDVLEEDGRPLGKVMTVSAGVANDVIELDSGLSLPMVEDCVRDIDLEAGHILVAPGFSDPD